MKDFELRNEVALPLSLPALSLSCPSGPNSIIKFEFILHVDAIMSNQQIPAQYPLPVYERSISSIIDFENCDTLSELLFDDQCEIVDIQQENAPIATAAPQNCASEPTSKCSGQSGNRMATLEKRNRQLQLALAAASIHHAREVAGLRREMERLKNEVEKLRQEKK